MISPLRTRVVVVSPQVPRAALIAAMVEVFVAKRMVTVRIMSPPHSLLPARVAMITSHPRIASRNHHLHPSPRAVRVVVTVHVVLIVASVPVIPIGVPVMIVVV